MTSARSLTRPPPSVHPTWLQVRVDGVARRVLLSLVRAVIPMPPVTRVPGASATLRGLIAWRGRLLPVVSPSLAEGAPELPGCAVVTFAGDSLVALAVDAVDGFVGAAEGEGDVIDPLVLTG